MPNAIKYDMDGNEIGEITLEDSIFNEEINEPVVHKVVKGQLAAKRSGTASTKTRNEVRGGGRKPWRQKGTGRARHGTIRSPLWVGGGVTFGPKPKDYSINVNKKEKDLAVKSVLSDKAQSDSILVVDELEFSEVKTKLCVEFLNNLNLAEEKVLILLPEENENVYLSARNIPDVNTLVADALNAYDLLDNDYIIIPEKGIQKIEEVFS